MTEPTLDTGLLSVVIEGKTFPFRADSDFAAQVCLLGEEAERRAAIASAEERNDPVEVAAFLSYAIDCLLGDGAVEEIFGEEIPVVLPLLDILDRITRIFCDYRRSRLAALKEGMA